MRAVLNPERSLVCLTLLLTANVGFAEEKPAADEKVLEVTPPPEATPVPPPAAPGGFRYEIFGLLRLKGGFIQDDPNVAFVGRNDGFTLQNARLGLQGAWERLFFRFSAEGAVDERVGNNATSGTLQFALKDAFLDVNLTDFLTLRVVRFEIIFDLEEYIPINERAFIDYSLESRGVLATQGYQVAGLSPGRSMGVALRSDHAFSAGPVAFGYELAAQNGNGELASANDNDSFAFSLSLFARAGSSFVFVAGRQKSRTVGDLPFKQTQDDLEGAAGALLRFGPAEVAGQIIARHTEFPTTGGPAQNSVGGHAQLTLALDVGGGLIVAPGYRYAIYDPSDLMAVDLVQEHTLGLTLKLKKFPLRLQANGTHVVEQAGRELDNDRLEGAFEVSF